MKTLVFLAAVALAWLIGWVSCAVIVAGSRSDERMREMMNDIGGCDEQE